MNFKIILFLAIFLFTVFGAVAQPGCGIIPNPFYICRYSVEHFDYLFYGEVISIENLDSHLIGGRYVYQKATIRVVKSFKGQLPEELTLYLNIGPECLSVESKNNYIFYATDLESNGGEQYFSKRVSSPMTNYSVKAVKEVLNRISTDLNDEKQDFVEGVVFERYIDPTRYTTTYGKTSLKTEDDDRLWGVGLERHKPIGHARLEIINEKTGKVYRVTGRANGTFRINKLPHGTYKVKVYLPADKEQDDSSVYYDTDKITCSKKWYIYVISKSPD